MDIPTAKLAARRLRQSLADDGLEIPYGRALELVARQLGHRDWNTASAAMQGGSMVPPGRHAADEGDHVGVGTAIPVLRVFDEALARDFYLGWLGFRMEWEHRFEPGLPLYARVRRDAAVLDLSAHHGDGTPGTVVWVAVADVAALHTELLRHPAPPMRPAIDADAPGGPTLSVLDPFGNELRFAQPD